MAAQQHTLPPIQQLEGQSHHSSSLPSQQYAHGPISSSNGGPVQPPPHHPAASQSQPQPPPQSHTQPPPPPTQHQQQHHPLPSHHPYTSYTDLNTPQSSFSSNGVLNGFSPPRYSHSAQNMDARQMSGGRHKKEIKRRTKTGCLTCRKRRIKCDEGHPTCRNCAKSKRDCLGYDPIFKTQGAPTAIQPAPGSSPAMSKSTPLTGTSYPAPMYASSQTTPHGYAPAVNSGYTVTAHPPHAQMALNNENGAPVDHHLPSPHGIPVPPDMPEPEKYTTILHPTRSVKSLNMDDLFDAEYSISSIPPDRPPDNAYSDAEIHEMREMYRRDYAPGLNGFFETPWYSTDGEPALLASKLTMDHFLFCLEQFRRQPSTHEEYALYASLEARLIWMLAILPRSVPIPDPAHDNMEIRGIKIRLNIVEYLLRGDFISQQDVPSRPARTVPDPLNPDSRASAPEFWYHLAHFTSTRDAGQISDIADHHAAIEEDLGAIRLHLSMQENRDVLYSMAIARHYGGRMDPYHPDKMLVSSSEDPDEPINKLIVAHRFLAQEETSGLSQIVQRLCEMARRSWFRGRAVVPVVERADEQMTDGQDEQIKPEQDGSNGMLTA